MGYLWSLGVVAEVVIFALSKSIQSLRCPGAAAAFGSVRSDSLDADGRDHGSSVAYRHADFALRHLYGLPPAAMRYISARQGSEVIRLQAVYSAVAMGGSIAVMTVFAGFLYQHLHQGSSG